MGIFFFSSVLFSESAQKLSERSRTGHRRKTKKVCGLCRRSASAWPHGEASEHKLHHRASCSFLERSHLPLYSMLVSHWLRSGEDIASRSRWLWLRAVLWRRGQLCVISSHHSQQLRVRCTSPKGNLRRTPTFTTFSRIRSSPKNPAGSASVQGQLCT